MTMDATTHEDAPKAPSVGFSAFAQSIGARNLFIAIVTMPIVFLLVVMAVIALFGKPGVKTEKVAAAPETAPAQSVLSQPAPLAATGAQTVSAFEPSSLILPAGEDITAMAVDGDRLVLRVKGPSGSAIVVYDMAAGATVKRIKILENPATGEL